LTASEIERDLRFTNASEEADEVVGVVCVHNAYSTRGCTLMSNTLSR
jgi:hypothetical protein